VLYLDTPVLAAEPGDWGNRLAEAMTKRFWADWRDLRHEPWTSADAGKRLAAIAARIRVALERDPHAKVSAPAPLLADFLPPAVDAAESAHIATGQCKPPPLVGPNEPRTWVVDPLAGRGDFRTISEAIQTAAPGDRLLVHPGCYQEGLRLEKPLEIIGHGKVDEIVVAASGRDAVFFAANFGRVANLTLRQTGGGPFYAVDIGQGRLELEGCDISSRSLAAIAIHGRADPAIRRNRIHDGLSCGVLVYEHGQGALEDNDIFGHALSAVEIKDGGHPVLRRNHLHDGQGAGLFVHHDGRGAFEDNEISGCATVGVAIQNGGNPLLRRNRIHGSAQSGVLVYEHGKGVLEDNDIAGNGSAGVMIKTGGAPTVRRNTINYNSKYGIIVWENSGGVFESNNLANNQPGPVYVHESSKGWIKVVGNIE
jgi:F-box protein 11